MSELRRSAEAVGGEDAVPVSVGLRRGGQRRSRSADEERDEKKKETPLREGFGYVPGLECVPGWERFPWLRAAFSTRQGGRSSVYGAGEQNLGWTREDDPGTVAANRERFLRAVDGGSRMSLVTVHQIHSGLIRDVETETAPWMTPEGKGRMRGDGLMSLTPGRLVGVITADCVPVLVADTRTRAVAAFHAGWRGTLARIVERGIGSLRLRYGSRPEDLVAAVGPCISVCCFAVGEEVRSEFESQFAYAPALFSEVFDSDPVRERYPMLFLTARAPGHSNLGPQIHMDLVEANRRQLQDAGVSAEKISVVGECTACTRVGDGGRKYYSHRGEQGFAGRMLNVIGALPE